MATPKILHLRSVAHEESSFDRTVIARGYESLSVRELDAATLARRSAILVEAHIDQCALLALKPALEAHLDQGGTLVFNGHLTYGLLDGLELFQVATERRVKDLQVIRVNPHPVFDGVDCHDLSFRKGVSGFYGRGANPAPEGAVILHQLHAEDLPVDWLWQRPGGGQVLMHGGNTMWMYQNDPTSAARIVPQLLDWLEAGCPVPPAYQRGAR
ncbi:hypothetical protein [Pseudomonas helleri]|uniref:hypothetical protein n=1 Tax=Pseudomonas helleri TaxID=1608996 RepID=UPI0030D97B70